MKNGDGHACNHADQFSRATGADWKLFSLEVEGAVRPGMAAEKNLQESSEFRMPRLQFRQRLRLRIQ